MMSRKYALLQVLVCPNTHIYIFYGRILIFTCSFHLPGMKPAFSLPFVFQLNENIIDSYAVEDQSLHQSVTFFQRNSSKR